METSYRGCRLGIIPLHDGRRLGYAEWGDPSDPAVLYCHGSPGSRLEIAITTPILARHEVAARVISFSRPGYGPSSFQAGREFVDWPADVAEAADWLGLDRFAMIGASGGAPFALACGAALGSRVRRLAIVVGSAPASAPGMGEAPAITGIPTPMARRRLQYATVWLAVKAGISRPLGRRMQRHLAAADQRMMADPDVRSWFEAVTQEAFASGGRGASYEGALYLRPWGFELRSVTIETRIYCGSQDHQIPESGGRWLAEQLPHATFALWPHGHFSWATSSEMAAMVGSLVEP